jgi:hypothetical protein
MISYNTPHPVSPPTNPSPGNREHEKHEAHQYSSQDGNQVFLVIEMTGGIRLDPIVLAALAVPLRVGAQMTL